MGRNRCLASVFALSSLAILAVGGVARAEIGTVRHVAVWAYGTPPQAARTGLYLADAVIADEVVETVEGGALHIRFLDDTELRLGSASQVVLDSFVYDPASSAGEFAIELGEGVFRIITGSLAKDSFAISTPVAVIGVRGTDFDVAVASDGATTVTVREGLVTITPRDGQSVNVGATQSVSVSQGGAVSQGAGAPNDPGLGAAPGGGQGASSARGGDERESSSSEED